MEIVRAKMADLEGIMELHRRYHVISISSDDKPDGFVTTNFTLGLLMIFALTACSENSASTGQQNSRTSLSVVPEKNQYTPETSTLNNSQAPQQRSASTGKRTEVTLTIGDTVLAAYLNDTTAAQELISRLPVTVSLLNSGHDYCGDINPPLAYNKADIQYGWRNGDLAFWTAGNDFVIFHADEEKSSNTGNLVIIGAVTSEIEKVRALPKSINVKIELAKQGGIEQ